MNLIDEKQAQEKGRQAFIKGLSELEGDATIVRNKVKKLISDYTKFQDIASVELSASLNKGVETHRRVLCSLHKATSQGLLEPLRSLDQMCPNKQGTLKALTIAQTNIASTLAILTPFANLQATLSKLKYDMNNEDKLPSVITQAARLSDHRARLLLKANNEQKQTLLKLFAPLDEFEVFVNSYIWKTIENPIEIAKKDSSALGKIVRIIEKIDPQPIESIKSNFLKGIEKRLEWLLGTDKLDELAENTHTAINELIFVLDNVVPSFPEKYDLRSFCISNYRANIEAAIDPHLLNLDKLREAPGLLVLIFQWINEYGEAIKKLCPGAMEDIEIQMMFAKVKELMPDFLSHMEGLLNEWIDRARHAHISNQEILELAAGSEALTDTFPEEMFSAINQQLGFISNRLNGEVLIEVFRVCSNRLVSQQKKQSAHILEIQTQGDPEVQIPSFCLSINNNQRASKHCLELQKFCQSKFNEEFYKERIENLFAAVHKGFLNLCNEAANCIAVAVVASVAQETVALLFTQAWVNSKPVSMAIATMEDYDSDICRWLASDFYVRKFRKRYFEILLQIYLEKLVVALKVLNPCNYEPALLGKIVKSPEESFNKKEVNMLLNGSFRELVYRDKFEFMEYSNKFEIGFNCDTFFSGLLRIREGGDTESLITAIQSFIGNSKELIYAVATVLTGKVYR